MNFITLKSFTSVTKNESVKGNSIPEKSERSYNIKVNKNSIIGSYSNDINLIELNKCILDIIDTTTNESLINWKQIKTEEEYKVSQAQFKVERANSLNLIKEADAKIIECSSDSPKNNYMKEISDVLENYKRLGPIKKYVTFGKNINYNNIEENYDKMIYRLSIIEEFLDISKKYVNINICKTISEKGCSSCGYDLSDVRSYGYENVICPVCAVESIELIKFKNTSENVNKKSPTQYEGRDNFKKGLAKYQGKSKNPKIPPNLVESLDRYFKERDLPTRFDIQNNPKLLEKTNKDLMMRALKFLGFTSSYKDINLICHLYWGWKLINLDSLETKIMNYYDQINEVYETIKGDRHSSLNVQYELWWILTLVEHQCKPSDFKMPKTQEIFEYHEKKREEISKILGWEYKPLNINLLSM